MDSIYVSFAQVRRPLVAGIPAPCAATNASAATIKPQRNRLGLYLFERYL
jgi:hypothetical protein